MKSVSPFTYRGTLQVPFSKSYLQRAIAIATLTGRSVIIDGFTPGNDAIAARGIAESLGASTKLEGSQLTLTPGRKPPESVTIQCGESGLSTRMFSPIAASLSKDVTVKGEGSILVRPMDMVIDALEQLGARVSSEHERLPLRIQGGIQSGDIKIDGSESSQLLTGVLIALSFLQGKSRVKVVNLKSIPYVQMTLDILRHFGVIIHHDSFQTFHISGAPEIASGNYSVEGDWSGASFHVVGASISGNVVLKGLNQHSAQADKAIIEAVRLAGAKVEWKGNNLHVSEGNLKAIEFDATHCPDLFPPLAAMAAVSKGTSVLTGVSRLASKESHRGLTIKSEMQKLGIEVRLEGDKMYVSGGQIIPGTIDSNNDHRIAMMGAILATKAKGVINITGPEAVNKSYPAFFEDVAMISKEQA